MCACVERVCQCVLKVHVMMCCESESSICVREEPTICIIAGGVRSIARENCSSFPGNSSSRNTFTPLSIRDWIERGEIGSIGER